MKPKMPYARIAPGLAADSQHAYAIDDVLVQSLHAEQSVSVPGTTRVHQCSSMHIAQCKVWLRAVMQYRTLLLHRWKFIFLGFKLQISPSTAICSMVLYCSALQGCHSTIRNNASTGFRFRLSGKRSETVLAFYREREPNRMHNEILWGYCIARHRTYQSQRLATSRY